MTLEGDDEVVNIRLMDEQMQANADGFAVIVEDVVGGAAGVEVAGRRFVAGSSVISTAVALDGPANSARAPHASLLAAASLMGVPCERHRSCRQRDQKEQQLRLLYA